MAKFKSEYDLEIEYQERQQRALNTACASHPFIWAHTNKIEITPGVEFTLNNTPYLLDCVNFKTPHNPDGKFKHLVIMKGAQSRLTTSMFLYAVWSLLYKRIQKNIMYCMPTRETASRMNATVMSPILENAVVSPYVQENNVFMKKIAGKSIVFVGANTSKVAGTEEKDSNNVRSVACDMVMCDEVDHIDDEIIEQSRERLLDSVLDLRASWGSPTIPGYGIDYMYNQTTMEKWEIKCQSCGKYTCLIDTFPKCLDIVNGEYSRVCVHCHAKIYVNDGIWVPRNKEARVTGKHIEGLLTPNAKLEEAMYVWHEGTEKQRVHMERSILGRPTMQSGSQLLEYMVLERCTEEYMTMSSKVQCVAGTDVNATLHTVIGQRIGEDAYRILWVGDPADFDELGRVYERFNVTTAFIDSMPDIHGSKKFANSYNFPVYRTTYSEYTDKDKVDITEGTATVNRNEWCDRVYETYSQKRIYLPKECKEVKEYAKSMTRTARTLVESGSSSTVKPRWVKIGDKEDHYFHATLYFLVAAKHSPIIEPGRKTSSGITVSSRYSESGYYRSPEHGGIYVPRGL